MAARTLEELPVLPLMGDVLFPNGLVALAMHRTEWDRRERELTSGPVLLAAIRPGRERQERARSLYRFGTVAGLVARHVGEVTVELMAIGLDRGKVEAYIGEGDQLRALVRPVLAPQKGKYDERSVLSELRVTLRHLGRFDPLATQLYDEVLSPVDDPWQLTDLIAANLLDSVEDQQRVLETRDPLKRVELVREHLRRLELTLTRSPWSEPSAYLN